MHVPTFCEQEELRAKSYIVTSSDPQVEPTPTQKKVSGMTNQFSMLMLGGKMLTSGMTILERCKTGNIEAQSDCMREDEFTTKRGDETPCTLSAMPSSHEPLTTSKLDQGSLRNVPNA